MIKPEPIRWRNARAFKPDSDVTVLLFMPKSDSEPVWPGYWTGAEWMLADGSGATGVTHFAEMPIGPNGGAK